MFFPSSSYNFIQLCNSWLALSWRHKTTDALTMPRRVSMSREPTHQTSFRISSTKKMEQRSASSVPWAIVTSTSTPQFVETCGNCFHVQKGFRHDRSSDRCPTGPDAHDLPDDRSEIDLQAGIGRRTQVPGVIVPVSKRVRRLLKHFEEHVERHDF